MIALSAGTESRKVAWRRLLVARFGRAGGRVAGILVAIAVLVVQASSPAAAAGPVAHAAGRLPSISAIHAAAGTPDGITASRVVVFIAFAKRAELTKIEGYTLQPRARGGSVLTERFAFASPPTLRFVRTNGTRWQLDSTDPRVFRPFSAKSRRVKLYLRACNTSGCSSRVITFDRTSSTQPFLVVP